MATQRRLFPQGNSVVLTITADNLAHIGCRKGDLVEIFKEDRKRLTIRKVHSTDSAVRTKRKSTGRGWGNARSGG